MVKLTLKRLTYSQQIAFRLLHLNSQTAHVAGLYTKRITTLIAVSRRVLLHDITVPFRPESLSFDRREGPYCEVAAMGQCFRSGHPLSRSVRARAYS